MWVSEDRRAEVDEDGSGIPSSGRALSVGPTASSSPFMRGAGLFISNWGRNSVTGLKGSLSNEGNLWVFEELLPFSVFGLCRITDFLSDRDAGMSGCGRTGMVF